MSYTYNIYERTLHFRNPAGTSRGTYLTRHSWYVELEHGRCRGVGECAPLPDLSCDAMPHDDYEATLRGFCEEFCRTGVVPAGLADYPSMLFGLETAMSQVARRGSLALFDTPFSRGEVGITINGLVWMGTFDEMYHRIEEKLKAGFRCVKLKIGAIDWQKEIELISFVRSCFGKEQIELRVDANGGFANDEAMKKLEQLSRFDIHSIEQPIRQKQWKEMGELCRHSPIPIALDEELIGVNSADRKAELLETIRPQYIVLKPSLHGGMSGCEQWVDLSRQMGIGSWITSALESNVGLNAVAQLTAKIYMDKEHQEGCGETAMMPQGLGTGQLFTDNIEMRAHTCAYKWFDGQAEAYMGREEAHGGIGTYHLRLPGIKPRRHGLALSASRLYSRQDDGGALAGARTQPLGCSAIGTSAEECCRQADRLRRNGSQSGVEDIAGG